LKVREYLNNEYLRKEYEDQRRFFYNPQKYEEVFKFSQQGSVSKNYAHDTVKPEKLTRVLVRTCSRKGDLTVIPFAGSGTECAMSAKEGRPFVAYEITKKHANMSQKRADAILRTPQLFN